MGHLHDTLYTSTCFHRRSKKRPTAKRQPNGNLRQSKAICHHVTATYGNLPSSTIFRHILPSLPNSVKFCQDYNLKPILPRVRVNQATKLTIYIPFFPFPYLLSLRNVLILSHSSCT